VQAGREQRDVVARRRRRRARRAVDRLEASYRYYADYRRRTTREIPVVVLEPK
jgi:hypothetical protein